MTDEELKKLQEEFKHMRRDHSEDMQQLPKVIEQELEERQAEPVRS